MLFAQSNHRQPCAITGLSLNFLKCRAHRAEAYPIRSPHGSEKRNRLQEESPDQRMS